MTSSDETGALRRVLKRGAFAVALAAVSPLVFLTKLEEWLFGAETERIFEACKETLSLVPTPIGSYSRLAYYWACCEGVQLDVAFLLGSMLAHRQVQIGRGSVVGARSIVGRARIGENVLLSAGVSILSGKYQHGRPAERRETGAGQGEFQSISIGNGAWIGQGALILADVGSHAVVGAGSVVYRAVEPGVTVLGNPARRVSLEPDRTVPAGSTSES